MKINRNFFLYGLAIVTAVFAVYFPITKTFYQQDEWLGYGMYLAKGAGIITQSAGGMWGAVLGQGRVLTNLLLFIFYKFWPLNIVPIAVFALIAHLVNVLLVFFLSRKLLKNNLPAFLGSLFFAVNSVAQSAISWPAASINTLPSTTLILLAIYLFFKFLETNNKRTLFGSFVLTYFSLFFKETGIFLFLLLPVYALYYKKQSLHDFIKTYWYYFTAGLFIVVFRIWGFKSDTGQVALFLTGSSKYFFDSIIVRAVFYPLTSFSLTLVPTEPFLNFARYITNVYYPFIPEAQFILVAQTVVLDFLAATFTALIGFILIPLLKLSDIRTRKNIIFWIIFLLASFLPYVIISKSYSYLESRYYYLAAAAWAIIFSWLLNLILEKARRFPVKLIAVLLYLVFTYWHVSVLSKDLDLVVKESQERIQILNQILKIKPTLTGKKNVFYVTGDTDYLLPGNKVPFQQGFGYTLMTFYYNNDNLPSRFLDQGFLFEIGEQGYKEAGGVGFGYFSDLPTLKTIINKNKISKDSITAIYYVAKQKMLIDITNETLKNL